MCNFFTKEMPVFEVFPATGKADQSPKWLPWKSRLDKDVRCCLMVSAIFLSPFDLEMLEVAYNSVVRQIASQQEPYRSAQTCLQILTRELRTPFLCKAEGLRYEMPEYLRKSVGAMWDGHLTDKYEAEYVIANLFEMMDTQEIAHRMDFIEIAHTHYVRSEHLADAARLLVEQQDAFAASGGSIRLLSLVERTLDAQRLGKQQDLVYLRARLLGKLAKYRSLHTLCSDEIPLLFPTISFTSRAKFSLIEARVNASRRCFDEAWEAFERVQNEIEAALNAGEDVRGCRKVLMKSMQRRCQTHMSQGAYLDAWEELVAVARELENCSDTPMMHELAVSCRHLHTLLHLNGEHADSLRWAEVALAVNRRIGDHEGVAILQYKLARAWLALSNVQKAERYCLDALRTLDAHVSGGRWWRMAFLETVALIHLAKYEMSTSKEHLTQAERYLNQAKQLCDDIEAEKEETVRAHLSEIYHARAILAYHQKKKWRPNWHKACLYLRTNPFDATSIVDVFRNSQLYYDYVKLKWKSASGKDRTDSDWVRRTIVPPLRQAANMLRDAGLTRSQRHSLTLLAEVAGEAGGLELVALEALFRLAMLDSDAPPSVSTNLLQTRTPLRKLLIQDGTSVEGLKDYPAFFGRVTECREAVETSLSGLIRLWMGTEAEI